MSTFDDFLAGYIEASLKDADMGRSRARAAHANVDEDTAERMVNESARFYDSHWHTIRNLIKRGMVGSYRGNQTPGWALAGSLLYASRNGHSDNFFKNRPGRSDRQAEESESQAIRLDHAAEKMGAFRLRVGDDDVIHGTWG